jgi:CYTH domain-containing protein
MIERTPGRGTYARTECEKRWLLGSLPVDLADPVEILDRYFPRSTLRLRRMQSGSNVVYKLGQKVRHDPDVPSLASVTNVYLTEAEFDLVGQVDGATLSKTRWHWTVAQREFSVDQFGGPLGGLVLAEIEIALGAAEPAAPPLTLADVTDDDRFSGGRLASLGPSEAADLLALVAGMTAPP